MARKINVTIYNEFKHEQMNPDVQRIYPQGIHTVLKSFLEKDEAIGLIRLATLENHEQMLTQEALDDTDVMIWWGHMAHHLVSDEVARRVVLRVWQGMGFLALHSAHASKPFQMLLGTDTQMLRWRENGERVRLWNIAKNHPITQGLGETFVVPHDETYGEPFDIPDPDQIIFLSWFEGGEVFRSGCVWRRGQGQIFYLQNGHETYPVYHQSEIQRIITNAVKWLCPPNRICIVDRGGFNTPALEGKRD